MTFIDNGGVFGEFPKAGPWIAGLIGVVVLVLILKLVAKPRNPR